MGQIWPKIIKIAVIAMPLLLACGLNRGHTCLQIPLLDEPYSHNIIKGGPIELDLVNTDGWQRSNTYTHIAKLDSGYLSTIYIDIEVDTFPSLLPVYEQLDSLKRRLGRVYNGHTEYVQYYNSEIYCDSLGVPFLIVESIAKAPYNTHTDREIRAFCVRGDYVISFVGGASIQDSLGSVPPEIRSRFLRWLPSVRLVE